MSSVYTDDCKKLKYNFSKSLLVHVATVLCLCAAEQFVAEVKLSSLVLLKVRSVIIQLPAIISPKLNFV